MGPGDFRRDAFEGAAGGRAGLGVPGFKLAGTTTEPEQDAVLLFLFGDLGKGGDAEKPGPTQGRNGPGGESLQKLAPVQVVVR